LSVENTKVINNPVRLSINIEQFAEPVFDNANRTISFRSWFKIPIASIFFSKQKLIKNWVKSLDSVILTLEGAINHVGNIPHQEAKELLVTTNKTIDNLNRIGEDLNKGNFLDSSEFKAKYKYMLKCLYKIEGKLHKSVYRNLEVHKSSDELKSGGMKLASSFSNVG